MGKSCQNPGKGQSGCATGEFRCADRRGIDDLTHVLSKKLLTDATFAIRASAEAGDLEAAEALLKAITQGERFSCERPAPEKRRK